MEKCYADIFSSPDPDIIFVFNKRSTLCCMSWMLTVIYGQLQWTMDMNIVIYIYLHIDNFKLKECTVTCEINSTTGLSFATRVT